MKTKELKELIHKSIALINDEDVVSAYTVQLKVLSSTQLFKSKPAMKKQLQYLLKRVIEAVITQNEMATTFNEAIDTYKIFQDQHINTPSYSPLPTYPAPNQQPLSHYICGCDPYEPDILSGSGIHPSVINPTMFPENVGKCPNRHLNPVSDPDEKSTPNSEYLYNSGWEVSFTYPYLRVDSLGDINSKPNIKQCSLCGESCNHECSGYCTSTNECEHQI